jgi:8-oxo-dGTP diphosphatase
MEQPAFHGCKGAFLNGDRVLCYLRDEKPGIPFPGHWDLPGGGREADETPEQCLLREVTEEFGLILPPNCLIWKHAYQWSHKPLNTVWFFGGFISDAEVAAVRFGDEGQEWQMMLISTFLSHDLAVPDLKLRLATWLEQMPQRHL